MFPSSKIEKDAIDLSIEFMQQNIEQPLSLREMAAEAHISPSHYAALFKKKTGYPPLEYFNHIKVQKACQYLHFTNLQVKEIAYNWASTILIIFHAFSVTSWVCHRWNTGKGSIKDLLGS